MANAREKKLGSLRELSVKEHEDALEEHHKELFTMRVRTVTKELSDPTKIRKARRDVARIKTLINEKKRAGV
jgi:large subunit ribosomal protein L29